VRPFLYLIIFLVPFLVVTVLSTLTQVRVSSGLCVTCSNKRAASSGGRHLMVDPDTGALMSAVAPPPVAAKNQALRKYLGQGEALSGAGNWGQKEQEEEEEKVSVKKLLVMFLLFNF